MQYPFMFAQEADAPAVFVLYQSMVGTPGCTWSEDYPTLDLVERDIRTGSLYVLKDSNLHIIAAAAAGADDELAEYEWKPRHPCELARVAVALGLQNRGIGSLLLRNVLTAVKTRGFDGIRMLVSIGNPHALALYDKHGFERLDIVHLYGHDFFRYQMVFQP